METPFDITSLAFVIVTALLCGLLFARYKQPPLVGYIIAGLVLGPFGFELVTDRAQIQLLAEIGIILLLFLIGLELDIRRFKEDAKLAVQVVGTQVIVGLLLMLALAELFNWSLAMAILLAFSVALSSTAVAIRILQDINEFDKPPGRTAVSVLIAQDLAVIPMMLTLALFGTDLTPAVTDMVANSSAGAHGGDDSLPVYGIAKLIFGVCLLFLVVRYLGNRVRVHLPFGDALEADKELVTLGALAFCFGAAALSGMFGLSPAYGAFLSGLFIGNSAHHRSIWNAAQPFYSVFIMVFFLSIGLMLDPQFIWQNLAMVTLLVIAATLAKTAVNIAILHRLGQDWRGAFLSGVVIGQIGEFSFLLADRGLSLNILDHENHMLLISVIAISLAVSPLWLSGARRLEDLASNALQGAGLGWRPLAAALYHVDEAVATARLFIRIIRSGPAIIRPVAVSIWSILVSFSAGLIDLTKRAFHDWRG